MSTSSRWEVPSGVKGKVALFRSIGMSITPGRVLPQLDMVGRFCTDDPVFAIFDSIGSLFYASS